MAEALRRFAWRWGRAVSSSRLLKSAWALGCAAILSACSSGMRRFPLADPLWVDPDQTPFLPRPQERYSGLGWDAADQTLFRPITRFFAVDPGGEAINVNALDEVADSSWFVNRLGRHPMTVAEVARGACDETPLIAQGIWTVIGAKPSGDNPGFLIRADDGREYLLKFDRPRQPERATTADVVGALVYHAAGYFVPCNRVVSFDASILRIDPHAMTDDGYDRKQRLTQAHIDGILRQAGRFSDGSYRANASVLLEGEPLGPFRYQGRRRDDPNDVVPHEDRRDLRGSYVLASWLNHFDSREQNTLETWVQSQPQGGYVRHHILDFGDSLGSLWDWDELSRRLGHAYYLDFPYLAEDFVTLGFVSRPWDNATFGPTGRVFGYYRIDSFVPDRWRPGYPNPAFSRMTERDAAWMARIIARFRREHIEAIVDQAKLSRRWVRDELVRVLLGRQEKILRRWLGRLSPLTDPVVVPRQQARPDLCLTDLALLADVVPHDQRLYAARAWMGTELRSVPLALAPAQANHVCVQLPTSASPTYLIVDVHANRHNEKPKPPARVHLYYLGGQRFHVAGLERPEHCEPPG